MSKEFGRLMCLKCLKEKSSKQNFYLSYNKWHSTGRMPYCKKCLQDHIDVNNDMSIKEIMRLVDKPYNYEVWEKAKREGGNVLGHYLRMINLNNKYDTYVDSVFEPNDNQGYRESEDGEVSSGYKPEDIEDVEFTKDEMEYLINFWGNGFTKDDYEYLQREYEKLTGAYESDSSYAMEVLFQEAAQQRLTIKKKRENGESVDRELKTFQDLLGSANIKPAQETGANSAEQATFGTLIKKFENEDPIPEADEDWEDVDGIKKYVSVWFLGHLCKMLGIDNEYAEMYEEEISKHTVEPPYNDSGGDDL